MKVFYDTEFLEEGFGTPIVPISMGLVVPVGVNHISTKYYEYYVTSSNIQKIIRHEWLYDNVVPHLEGKEAWMDRGEIATDLVKWLTSLNPNQEPIELWGYYPAYDHVVLAQTFGRMIDFPDMLPKTTFDLQYLILEHGLSGEMLPQQKESTKHNALEDAKWNYTVYNWLQERI